MNLADLSRELNTGVNRFPPSKSIKTPVVVTPPFLGRCPLASTQASTFRISTCPACASHTTASYPLQHLQRYVGPILF